MEEVPCGAERRRLDSRRRVRVAARERCACVLRVSENTEPDGGCVCGRRRQASPGVGGPTEKMSTPGLRNCENGDCIVGSVVLVLDTRCTRVERTRCANHTSLHTRVQLLIFW